MRESKLKNLKRERLFRERKIDKGALKRERDSKRESQRVRDVHTHTHKVR